MLNKKCWTIPSMFVFAICGMAAMAISDDDDQLAPASQTDRASAADKAEIKKQAQALLKTSADAYRALASYQDNFKIEFDAKTKDGDEGVPGMETQNGTLKFARPNRIQLKSQQREISSDGQTLWVKWNQLNQYTETQAPQTLSIDDVAQQHALSFMSDHPAINLLLASSSESEDIFDDFKNISAVTAEERNGEQGHRIKGEIEIESMPISATMPCSIWLSDATHLISELRFDMKPYMDAMAEQMRQMHGDDEDEADDDEADDEAIDDPENVDDGNGVNDAADGGDEDDADDDDYGEDEDDDDMSFMMPKFEKLDVIISLSDIVVNQEIAPEAFVFKPEGGDEKVEEFGFGGEMEGESDQDDLIGKPAPEFSGLDLDGKTVALNEYRGRVVLLDFWATWCGPCVQAIPHVQKIADRFADKPVTVLGINQDSPGAESRVKKFLDKKKITFRQVMPPEDMEDGIGNKYSVRGIPCSVLIDQNGVVQDIHVGFGPDMVDELGEQIEKLLAGESLFDPATLERKSKPESEEADEEDDPEVAPDATAESTLEEVTPARLVEQGKARGQIWGYQAQRIDVDGDGTSELVCTSATGGIDIVSSDGAAVQKVKLKGVSQGSSVSAFRTVNLDGELHWLVAVQKYSMSGNSTAEVALHKRNGERLWAFKPKLPPKTSCTLTVDAGDLNGDGRPECAVAMSTHQFKSTKRGQMQMPVSQKAFIAILDASGALISQRRVGSTIEFMQINPAKDQNAGVILCISNSRLRRFGFDPAAPEVGDTVAIESERPAE